jgi:DNA-binding NarL/FixJ family response regulator
MGKLVVREAGMKTTPKSADALTAREREVLAGVVRGHTNAHIARELRLSVKTVEWHRANLTRKLGTHGVADLVRYAIERGLVDIDETVGA